MLSRKIFPCLVCVFILLGSIAALAQDAVAWRVESARALPIPNDASLRVFPSLDGLRVAYERGVRLNGHKDYYLCVLETTVEREPACSLAVYQPPLGYEPDPNSYFLPLSWSPDSSKIAVVGQPLVALTDMDLWIYDVAAQSWTNLADDGYEGTLSLSDGNPALPPGVVIDVQPVWSPDSTQIALERTITGEDGAFISSRLVLIDIATGETRELTPLPGHENHERDAGSTTSMAWSPDGKTLAVSVKHQEVDVESDGLWLVSVETGESMRLASIGDVQTALKSVYADLTLGSIGPVFWSPDGNHLLLWAGNPGKRPVVAWPFWMSADGGEVMAVPMPAHPKDDLNRRNIRPLQAAWSPDSRSLLVFALGVLPDDEVKPLDPGDISARTSLRLIDLTTGTDQMLGNLPLSPSVPLYVAAWSHKGDAVLGGYHLKLAGE